MGACDEDPTLACTESTQDTASFARQANQTADVLDSKCLEVETFTTVKRNLLEHGLPLMLRTTETGNSFSEYFVCIHSGGEHFSLLDRKICRDKNNFHYAWEDLRSYHFVQPVPQIQEVAAERQALQPSGYFTEEVVRCTFSESCCPQQMDLMFKSKEALQCMVEILQSKMLNETVHSSLSPGTTRTPSCTGAFLESGSASPANEVFLVPSPDPTPQAVVRPSSPLPTIAWPSPKSAEAPTTAEVPPKEEGSEHSERPADWALMSQRSLNSFYAV
ncbi:unnamed protein product [Effrenium voratum]|nr:unnamed protein product [Effrenium voratum]